MSDAILEVFKSGFSIENQQGRLHLFYTSEMLGTPSNREIKFLIASASHGFISMVRTNILIPELILLEFINHSISRKSST